MIHTVWRHWATEIIVAQNGNFAMEVAVVHKGYEPLPSSKTFSWPNMHVGDETLSSPIINMGYETFSWPIIYMGYEKYLSPHMDYGPRKIFVAQYRLWATKNICRPIWIIDYEKNLLPHIYYGLWKNFVAPYVLWATKKVIAHSHAQSTTAQENLSPGQRRRGRGDDFCDDFFRSPYGKGDKNLVWATILIVAQCCFSCSAW